MISADRDISEDIGASGPLSTSETTSCGREIHAADEAAEADYVAKMAVRGDSVWSEGDRGNFGEVRVRCDYGELTEKICRVDEGDSLLPKEMCFH